MNWLLKEFWKDQEELEQNNKKNNEKEETYNIPFSNAPALTPEDFYL